jgi:type VI secretion system protein ImpL
MRKIILIVVSALLAYLILAWFAGGLLGLTGAKLWILRAGLGLIGLLAACAVVGYFWAQQKAATAPEEGIDSTGDSDIASLMSEAGRKLGAAHLGNASRIDAMPAILVLGEGFSSKTSVVLHSGLEPELLSGQVFQEGKVISTRGANIWYSHGTLLVEAGGASFEDASARKTLLKALRPGGLRAALGSRGQSPRAVLLCVEADRLINGGQTLAARARGLRARLGEIAELFGISLPVYVLFTKMDRLPFFADYVRNLTKEEAAQALGARLPMAGTGGIYAEEQSARLGAAFDGMTRALSDARIEILRRENDATKLPGAYEFPREFRKLRGTLIEFLVELCRPSQLTAGPFLRGFYFSAVRPVVVQEALVTPEREMAGKPVAVGAGDATSLFRVAGGGGTAVATPQRRTIVSHRVPQWLFLTRFFNDVLMADRAAAVASGTSTHTIVLRRVLLGAAVLVCLVAAAGCTVSFFLNRELESQVRRASQAEAASPADATVASVVSLSKLEILRQSLATLREYRRAGAPWRYRWGLYVGNDLYDGARRIYFKRFQQVLFGQTQEALVTFLSGLPAAPAPGSAGYDQTYNALKAYLITTSNHEKSSRAFLSPVLCNSWNADHKIDPERLRLAQLQFDFYAEELRAENPFSKQPDDLAVSKARGYLKQFGDLDRVYQAMKAGSPQAAINFNRQVADSTPYIIDAYSVPGPFTKDGWKFMDDAIRNPSRYVHGELWVLGDDGAVNSDPHELIQPLLTRYEADYVKEWRNYLGSAGVTKYKDLKDAAQKLTVLAGSSSPLFQLFALASQNIPWDGDSEIAKALEPIDYLEPHKIDRIAGPQIKEYLAALGKLQSSVDAAANTAAGTDIAANQALSDARDARAVTNQLALNFNPDPVVQKLLLEPIEDAEARLHGAGASELNAGGQALCAQFHAVLGKYPFSTAGKQDATVAEVNQLLHSPDGALWQFYNASLQKLLIKQGNQYASAAGSSVALSPAFIGFFNQAAAISDALYAAGSPDPHFGYKLTWLPSDGVTGLSLQIDGQSGEFSAAAPSKQFNWVGSGSHLEKATVRLGGGAGLGLPDHEGAWALFRFFAEADSRGPAAGGGELLEWIIRSGAGSKPLTDPASGKPLVLRLQLEMAGSPAVFQKNFFARLACVAVVAKH